MVMSLYSRNSSIPTRHPDFECFAHIEGPVESWVKTYPTNPHSVSLASAMTSSVLGEGLNCGHRSEDLGAAHFAVRVDLSQARWVGRSSPGPQTAGRPAAPLHHKNRDGELEFMSLVVVPNFVVLKSALRPWPRVSRLPDSTPARCNSVGGPQSARTRCAAGRRAGLASVVKLIPESAGDAGRLGLVGSGDGGNRRFAASACVHREPVIPPHTGAHRRADDRIIK